MRDPHLPKDGMLELEDIPNSDSVGFQSLGGEWCQQNACSGKPEQCWNLAGTLARTLTEILLNLARVLLEPCWNLVGTNPAGTSLEPCWNLAEIGAEPRQSTTLEPWNSRNLQPCNPGNLQLWNPGTLESLGTLPDNIATLEPWSLLLGCKAGLTHLWISPVLSILNSCF